METLKKLKYNCGECLDVEKDIEELQHLALELKGSSIISDLPNFSSALASKERLIILNLLKGKDRCVCELDAVINKSQSTISHHLRKLEIAGLIKSWNKGNFTYYHLKKERLKAYLSVLKDFFDDFKL